MEQFEQLLTCAICLDRYRNPKLLPCQHSFCMEPCMDGLVDYVRRQVKCPECRAEHRIPYQGVQGYPTNVTLQRFLELHIEITGELPDPTSGQIMERCSVCSEKSYCSLCVHCDKKVCADCKGAHMDILRREIARVNNQVRRGIHRLQDALALVEKNQVTLLNNCTSVTEEIDEIHRRLLKALKDRTDALRSEIERYQSTEQRNLRVLKDNLEQELSNIQSNCELADKHMNDNVDWDDCELMDAKEIFLKTVEFIRNFEYENVDYTRRVRFTMATDPNQLVLHVANYGDLTITSPYPTTPGPGVGGGGTSGALLQPPAASPGLMRSKSDHRLASQFRQDERGGYFDSEGGGQTAGGRSSPIGSRKFGERYASRGYGGESSSRYGRGGDDYGRGGGGGDYEYDESGGSGGRASRRYRSRLASRHLGGADGDSDNDAVGVGGRSVRFSGDCGGGGGGGGPQHHVKERERVLDTEDASRGPLSGITRLLDSPRVMKRLQESELRSKKREKEPVPAPAPQATPKAATTPVRRTASRQVSEDDEISKIKKQNKASGSGVEATSTTASSGDTTTTTTTSSTRPQSERVAALKQQRSTDAGSEESSSGGEPARRTPPATVPEVATSDGESDDTSSAGGTATTTTTASAQRKTSVGTAGGTGRRTSDAGTKKVAVRSASSDSSTSSESSSSAAASPARTTAPATTATSGGGGGESSGSSTPRGRLSSAGSDSQPRFQSRFLANRQQQQQQQAAAAAASATKEEDEDEEETESSSESEETDSEEESDDGATKKKASETVSTSSSTRPVDRTDIGPLLARSAHARDTNDTPTTASRRRDSRDEASSSTPGYRRYSTDASATPSYRYGANKDKDKEDTGSKYLSRSRATHQEEETPSSRYGSSGYTSRFLNKSKSSAALSPEEDSDSRKYGASGSSSTTAGADDSSSRYPSGRSRYAALKDRRARLARSRSSHNFGGDDQEDQDDSPTSPTSAGMPASYLPSRYAPGSSGGDLARSRSTHALKSRENSPDRPGASTSATSGSGEKDGAALSSWARYLKNKYGNRAAAKEGKDGASGSGSTLGSGAGSSTSASRRLSLGLPLRHNSASIESSDDDQKNPPGSPTSPTAAGFAAAAGTSPRSQYLQKRRQLFKIGSRGSEPGNFTWPRGIAVGPDNSIVVADSSNHRVQVFDSNGTFVKEFGSYGSGEGEFDCLAGVAVNRIGQFIIADRYNHRIQVMDPSGRFLRAFGSQGSSDGRFNYPWGVTTDALGFIYVCDKENHRVQVFQSDGTFVGKFGSIGSKPGQLEHPHYIAVSNTNRVIVSDSNNHRVQIFDVNGRVITTFGNEGSEDGQFKFPRHAKRAKSSRPRGSHHNHRAITTRSTKPLTSNTSITSTSPPSTLVIKQGRRSGRPGLHLCGGFRQQPNSNLPPRLHIPQSIRLLGVRGRGVQRTGRYSSYIERQHPGLRPREPSCTSILSSAHDKRLNFNPTANMRRCGPVRRTSLPAIPEKFLASPMSLNTCMY